MTVYTVVCAYRRLYEAEEAHKGQPAVLFYDCCEARSPALAIAEISEKCPGTPTDIIVFPGELYDIVPPREEG